jgi:hypothetical protein
VGRVNWRHAGLPATSGVVLLFMALLLCTTAHAATPVIGGSGLEVSSSTPTAEFTLPASEGYRLVVGGELGEHGAGAVTLFAERPSTTIEYGGRGRVTKQRIEASFGRLGSVSVHFHPSGRVRHVHLAGNCDHSPRVVSAGLGTFVGSIRFRGEAGYTKVIAHRANGGIGDPLAITPEPCEGFNEKRQSVTLEARIPSRGFSFSAEANSPWVNQRPRFFEVTSFEEKRPIPVARLVWITGPEADFVWNEALTSATVTPPPPFSGAGTLQSDADGSLSWSGLLSVQMPGLGQVALTGPAFETELRRPQH